MKNKKGLSGLGKIGTVILIVVVISFFLVFVNRANILDYFRALPYSDYQPEDEDLGINISELEETSAYNDVEVVIDFDYQGDYTGLLWGQIDRQENNSGESAWFVNSAKNGYIRGDLPGSGHFKINPEEDGFDAFTFSAGLVKFVNKLDSGLLNYDYNNVRASVRLYDSNGFKLSREIYRSDDSGGEVDNGNEKANMINTIRKKYFEALAEDLGEEELDLKDAVQSNQITLIFTNGFDDYVYVRWDFENGRPIVVVLPNNNEESRRIITDGADGFFVDLEIRKDIYIEDSNLIWDLVTAKDSAEFSNAVLKIAITSRAYIENYGSHLRPHDGLNQKYVNNLLYGVEDIQSVLDRYGGNENGG